MATKLGIFRSVHLLVKQNPVGMTVSDDDQMVNTINLAYDAAIAHLLEQGLWNFATRTVQAEASDDISSQFGFNFVFEKPADYAGRLVALSANEYFRPPLQHYHEDGGLEGYFFADNDPLYIRYISNSSDYGLNLGAWPASFTRAVEYEIAYRVAPHITNMSAAEKEELRKEKVRALRDARSKDALNQAPERPPVGRLVQSRRGGMGRRDYWRSE